MRPWVVRVLQTSDLVETDMGGVAETLEEEECDSPVWAK